FDNSSVLCTTLCPRTVESPSELNLNWFQIVIRVIDELLTEDKEAVKRRTHLMRHVSKELALVFGSERQFFGLLFQCTPRLLNLLVLPFDLGILLSELPGFLG